MADISTWSPSAASNNDPAPNGFPELMAPSGVNDAAREVMASIRRWYEDSQWIDLGYTHTFVSTNQFRIAGVDYTDTYHVGRRVRLIAATPGTIYGTISASAFSTDTTVTVAFDSGVISNEPLGVSLGALTTVGSAFPGGSVPIGSVTEFYGTTEPDNWLFCYGQAISRTDFGELFAVLGTTYGIGDGSTTFNMPDLRGRVVAGKDDMGSVSADRLTGASGGVDGDGLGNTGGSETHTLLSTELASHIHIENGLNGFTAAPVNTTGPDSTFVSAVTSTPHSTDTQTGGGGAAHNNVQPTFIANKIMRYR